MPAYEFKAPDGEIIEELFIGVGDWPTSIERNGKIYTRIPSRTVTRFVGMFSGATKQSLISKPDDGSIVEPGMKNDAYNRKQEIEKKNSDDLDTIVGDCVKEYYNP